MKRRDPDVIEIEGKIRDGKDRTLFYINLSRRAKDRGDVSSYIDCWYKARFCRVTYLYWSKVLNERELIIRILSAPKQQAQ